jgi:protein-S-isoprenylcysteine O-methyltransferase Ste14
VTREPSRRDAPDIVILPPVLGVGAILLGLAVHEWVWRVTPFPLVAARFVAVLVGAAAALLVYRAHHAMSRAGTNVFPTKPALALVESGPFRRSRNPIYIALLGVCLATALWVDSLAMLLIVVPVAAVLHWGVVLREEMYLETKFGDAYRAYCSRVPRWI